MILTYYLYTGNIHSKCLTSTVVNKVQSNSYTCFDGNRRIATGTLPSVAPVVKRAIEGGAAGPVLIFDDATGRSIDINIRGSDEEVVARLANATAPDERAKSVRSGRSPPATCEPVITEAHVEEPRGRGRPKLGVVPREVTLLPRHWEWLATQPGGASVALRKLVEEARRTHADKDRTRMAQERAYHFMSAMAGDLPGFEKAIRALFAKDRPKFSDIIAAWPGDVRGHATWLAFGDDVQHPLSND
jgi:hypothetical protein